MISVKSIKAPIELEMKEFEQKFRTSMKSKVPLLDKITHYIIKRKGKQMRPMFVFLSAKLCGNFTESTYTAASLIELLHTASLVHDDVVDDATHRRGFFSLNALWKNKIAVLVGDYLLSQGLLLSINNSEFDILKIVSEAVKEMSEGELLQMEKTRKLNITEEIYFEIIRQKTASLIAACCASGSSSVGSSTETVALMKKFGEYVGIAFQIKDDIFDYGSGKNIGKPTGIDIKEKKLTLPLIHALNQGTKSERRSIVNTIKNHNENKAKVAEVISFVMEKKGLDYAAEKMHEYKKLALDILDEFTPSPSKQALHDLVIYTTERNK